MVLPYDSLTVPWYHHKSILKFVPIKFTLQMAGFPWKQGKQFLLTKLINYAKLLEQQTQADNHHMQNAKHKSQI